MKKIPMTIEWALHLREELSFLQKINVGIYSEDNAARELQMITLSKIKELEFKLINADISKNNFFAVILKNLNNKQILYYKIVGDDESLIKDNTISIYSPLAYMLRDKREGDLIILNTFLGFMQFQIIDIINNEMAKK